MRVEFKLQLSRKVQFREQLVLADIGGNHLPDLAVVKQLPEPKTICATIVGNDCKVLDPGIEQTIDQTFRIA